MRRSYSASRLQKIGPAIGARLEQTKQFFAGSQARSSSSSGLRKLVPETNNQADPIGQSNLSSTNGLQKLGPAMGDRWDQFRNKIGLTSSGSKRQSSRSSSRPPLLSSWVSSKSGPAESPEDAGQTCEIHLLQDPIQGGCEDTDDDKVEMRECINIPAEVPLLNLEHMPLTCRLSIWPQWFTAPDIASIESLVQGVPQDVAVQIGKDVPRTQPRRLGPAERGTLKRVLSAYAVMNPTVGYCQGMNNIAAVFVILGFDEATALRGFCSLVHQACPGYHDAGLRGYLRDVAVLETLVRSGQVLPVGVSARLDALEVPLDILASEHFISLASHSWPLAAIVQLWDLVFQEGAPAVFASFLALLQMYLPAEGEAQQPVEEGIPGVVVDCGEPVDVFRRAILRGVSEDLAAFLQQVRDLIPKVPQALVDRLRAAHRHAHN